MLDYDIARVRVSIRRDRPLGDPTWTLATAKALGLEYSLRPPGRPPRRPIGLSRPSLFHAVSFPVLPYRQIGRIRQPKAKSAIFTIIPTKLSVSPGMWFS